MDTPIVVALLAGAFTAIGWLVNHVLSGRRERMKSKVEASLQHVEQQLQELYGPLAFLIYEGRQTFRDLLDSLGRSSVFELGRPLPKDELETWLFWAEHDLMPRNEQVKKLLMAKSHLIEGARFPGSYVDFLNHHNSWELQHRRWKMQGVEYSWHSKVNWPSDFGTEVVQTFEMLKRRHATLLSQLSD